MYQLGATMSRVVPTVVGSSNVNWSTRSTLQAPASDTVSGYLNSQQLNLKQYIECDGPFGETVHIARNLYI